MESVAKRHRRLAATILFGLILGPLARNAAHAAPPALRTWQSHAAAEPSVRPSSAAPRSEFARLDLRAPTKIPGAHAAAADASFGKSSDSVPFPSMRRGAVRSADPAEDRAPSIGELAVQSKSMSRPEELARRFHREGLPIARLWESHSALVSVGLSPRGKPGIWLIQKLP
jgi:hypothetical protein